jgi:V/A-type H+-transporting ATPase subunit K
MATSEELIARVIIAGFVLAVGTIGTAWAQGRIGSSVAALLSERPESFGQALILTALPETGLVLAFVLAIMILLGIGLV